MTDHVAVDESVQTEPMLISIAGAVTWFCLGVIVGYILGHVLPL